MIRVPPLVYAEWQTRSGKSSRRVVLDFPFQCHFPASRTIRATLRNPSSVKSSRNVGNAVTDGLGARLDRIRRSQ